MFKDNYLFDTTEKLMTNETLSRLYGIDIKKVCFEEKGENIQSVIPIF